MARTAPAEESLVKGGGGEAFVLPSAAAQNRANSVQVGSQLSVLSAVNAADPGALQGSTGSRNPFAELHQQGQSGGDVVYIDRGVVWGHDPPENPLMDKTSVCLDFRGPSLEEAYQQLQVLSSSLASNPAIYSRADVLHGYTSQKGDSATAVSTVSATGASYQAGLLASEEEALLKRLLLLQLEKQRLAEQSGATEGVGSQQVQGFVDFSSNTQLQAPGAAVQGLSKSSQSPNAQGGGRQMPGSGPSQQAWQRKDIQGRANKESKARQSTEGSLHAQQHATSGSKTAASEGNRRRMARGPRSEGPVDLEPMYTEDHRVLKVERSEDGREAYVWVTLLAAGFVIGSSGAAARQIGHVTGAGLQSWTETATGIDGVEGEEIRRFRIQGKKEKVERVITLIHSAVDKYKELCDRKREGQFVLREHRIDGVDFQYQPPPRKALQTKQGVAGSAGPSTGISKRSSSPRKLSQHQQQSGSREPRLRSPRPSGSSDSGSSEGREHRRGQRSEKRKQNQHPQQLQQNQDGQIETSGDIFQKLEDVEDKDSSLGDSGLPSPIVGIPEGGGMQEKPHIGHVVRQQVIPQLEPESYQQQLHQHMHQQMLRRQMEDHAAHQQALHQQRQSQQIQHDQQLGLALEALADTLGDQGTAKAVTSGSGSSGPSPASVCQPSNLKLQGAWGAPSSAGGPLASTSVSSGLSASQHLQALQQQQMARQQVHWPWHAAGHRLPGPELNGDRWFDLEQSSISSTVLSGGGSSSRGGGSSGNSSPGGSAQGLSGLLGARGQWWHQGSGYGSAGQITTEGTHMPVFSEVQFPSLPSKAPVPSSGMMQQQQSFAGVLSRGGQLQGYRAAVGAQRDMLGLSRLQDAQQQQQHSGRDLTLVYPWDLGERGEVGEGGHLPHALLQDTQLPHAEMKEDTTRGGHSGGPGGHGEGMPRSASLVLPASGSMQVFARKPSNGTSLQFAGQPPGPFTFSSLFTPINQSAGGSVPGDSSDSELARQQQGGQDSSGRGPRVPGAHCVPSTKPVLAGRPEGLGAAIGLEGSQLCVVCCQRPVLFSYFPCAHQVICHVCCKSVMHCPMCGVARSAVRSGSPTAVSGLPSVEPGSNAASQAAQTPTSVPRALLVCDPALLPAQLGLHLQRRSASLEGFNPHVSGGSWMMSSGVPGGHSVSSGACNQSGQ